VENKPQSDWSFEMILSKLILCQTSVENKPHSDWSFEVILSKLIHCQTSVKNNLYTDSAIPKRSSKLILQTDLSPDVCYQQNKPHIDWLISK